ncbi:MAG: arsenite methyltransferase [Gemmatimonadota bacterium]
MKTGEERLRETVREKYGEAAKQAARGTRAHCGPSPTTPAETGETCGGAPRPSGRPIDPVTADLYDDTETAGLPREAVLASLGCGNPTALAELREGEVVLDLGSGGGIDVLLSARRVGPSGRAYGLDTTPEMLELARRNQREAGVENAEFLEGRMEEIPLPDESVDVIVSNCVVNLSTDKPRVLAEAFRVLRPGGRLAIADIVVRGAMDARIRASVELWIGCVAGALEASEYVRLLEEAGFEGVDLEPTRIYGEEDAAAFVSALGSEAAEIARQASGRFMSAFVRATKPA